MDLFISIKAVNYLPKVGLYNGVIGTVIKIVHKNIPIGPNNKAPNLLPYYVVVDFLHLNLPDNIYPLDCCKLQAKGAKNIIVAHMILSLD